jgi:hypothetical protein
LRRSVSIAARSSFSAQPLSQAVMAKLGSTSTTSQLTLPDSTWARIFA